MTSVVKLERRAPQTEDGARIGHVRVAPDGSRLAFARFDGAAAGVYVCRIDGSAVERMVNLGGWRVDDLAWSPSGVHLSYLMREEARPGGGPRVGWCRAAVAGQVGYLEGSAMGWTPRGNAFLVVNPMRGALVRQMVASGRAQALIELRDTANPQVPAAMAISPDGSKTAYVTHHEDHTEVWVSAKDERNAVSAELLTEVPGAGAHALPFWSPKGVTLGLWIVHLEQQKTGLVLVPRLEGEGLMLYERELLCPVHTPAWSPSGRAIVLWAGREAQHRHTKVAAARLMRLDPQTRTLEPLLDLGDEVRPGPTWFIAPDRLVVDGGTAAHVLTLDEPL